ncbi:MAG: A/G-specific adenine glycosylase [Deltaproteobacteria bacterium]|nr:A/G-specific adenine glycosylase [Deltaproteobacteria bacterium]
MQQQLLFWYRRHKRDLPWRRTKDPYRIWVSEIMLQQTTVETVIPYYHRFLERFPTVRSLGRAREESVLRLWSGLGYYSRARNLHSAAKILIADVTRSLATFPKTATDWQQLPGVGRTTAGAIVSIAFDQRAPILDGNVIRVLSRVFAIEDHPKTGHGQKIFWRKSEEILPQKNCGDFNQALMELGATVCHVTNPACPDCPLSSFCLARKEGQMESYPRGRGKTVYRNVLMSAAMVRRNGSFLMVRRPDKGSLKKMWEFPMVEGNLHKLVKAFPVIPQKELPIVRHAVMNRRLTIAPYLCTLVSSKGMRSSRWIAKKSVLALPTSSMNLKLARLF